MPLQFSILKTLAYFDIFDYPITQEEIMFFLDRETGDGELKMALSGLVKRGCIFRLGPFYSLQNNLSLKDRRARGNNYARNLLQVAGRISCMLYQFPYVRGIGISGSLSKNFADEHADIDYFIITRSNRLWIARTFMHLYKKWTFVTGRQHLYCMNYYIDEEALKIEEKNIFTAIELITLIPVCGNGKLTDFFAANDWVTTFLPRYSHRARTADNVRNSFFKRGVEWCLNNRLGDLLDDLFRKITARRWAKKEALGIRTAKGFSMSLKTGKHFSRPNPEMLQKKILTVYSDKLSVLNAKWNELN